MRLWLAGSGSIYQSAAGQHTTEEFVGEVGRWQVWCACGIAKWSHDRKTGRRAISDNGGRLVRGEHSSNGHFRPKIPFQKLQGYARELCILMI